VPLVGRLIRGSTWHCIRFFFYILFITPAYLYRDNKKKDKRITLPCTVASRSSDSSGLLSSHAVHHTVYPCMCSCAHIHVCSPVAECPAVWPWQTGLERGDHSEFHINFTWYLWRPVWLAFSVAFQRRCKRRKSNDNLVDFL
jgi:hypothetical protein